MWKCLQTLLVEESCVFQVWSWGNLGLEGGGGAEVVSDKVERVWEGGGQHLGARGEHRLQVRCYQMGWIHLSKDTWPNTNSAPTMSDKYLEQIIIVLCNHWYHPFHSREKLVQFKKATTEEIDGTLAKLSNDLNPKEVELSNEESKDKSAAACWKA